MKNNSTQITVGRPRQPQPAGCRNTFAATKSSHLSGDSQALTRPDLNPLHTCLDQVLSSSECDPILIWLQREVMISWSVLQTRLPPCGQSAVHIRGAPVQALQVSRLPLLLLQQSWRMGTNSRSDMAVLTLAGTRCCLRHLRNRSRASDQRSVVLDGDGRGVWIRCCTGYGSLRCFDDTQRLA